MREFWSINDFILRNWGHVLTPFLDTYLEINEMKIGRRKSNEWLTRELPMGYNADDKAIGYDQVQGWWLAFADG